MALLRKIERFGSLKGEMATSTERVNTIEDTIKTEEIKTDKADESVKPDDDVYGYTKFSGFTSELYKIEISGLPSCYGYGQLKQLLNSKLKLNAHKLKSISPRATWAFATFKCEEDREKALEVINGFTLKGKLLSAKKANPAADPLIKKRKGASGSDATPSKKTKGTVEDANNEDVSPDLKLKEAVTPLWNKTYEEQLQIKEKEIRQALSKLGRKIEQVYSYVPEWLKENRKMYDFMCCPVESVRAAPQINGYRNKCEFTIGMDPTGSRRTVGFRLASYTAGSMCVVNASDCVIVPDATKNVARVFEDYIQDSDKETFNPVSHAGYWRQLTVRTTSNSEILAIVQMHPQNLTLEELQKVKDDCKAYFQEGNGKSGKVTTLMFHTFAKKTSDQEEEYELLYGPGFITETILGMTYKISPAAFFQVNTPACEILYSVISEIVNPNENTLLLDICCGTGPIGISLAKKVGSVLGIEKSPSAIENAKLNAEANGLTNVEFVCGKVEDVIHAALVKGHGKEIVAIVDPPRAGLHVKVIRGLRMCRELKRLLYVSCDYQAATTNFVDLCRPTSNRYKEDPFVPTRAYPVDLFPHTHHCELVLLFERK